MRYYWKVKVWDGNDQISDWSLSAWWEMALLSPSEWQAQWIGGTSSASAPFLRKQFNLSKQIKQARIYVTSLGDYEVHLNGARVGDNCLTPGFTNFNKQLMYQTYDVTSQLVQGDNAVGAILGDGWYAGNISSLGPHIFGSQLYLKLQMMITFTDDTTQQVLSDNTWKLTTNTPIVYDDYYNGEQYNAQLEITNWDTAGFNDSAWNAVGTGSCSATLFAQKGPTMKITADINPIAITNPSAGKYIFDMGQNMSGWVKLTVAGPAGTQVVMRFGEELSADGTLYTASLRSAQQTDKYTLKGQGTEVYEPRFTYHGFRYVEVTGFPGVPTLSNIVGRQINVASDMIGTFLSSSVLLNKIHRCAQWGIRGNYYSVPSDCPQRDERQGWTGDALPRVGLTTYNFDSYTFFEKFCKDMRTDQLTNGSVPDTVPHTICGDGSPGWGDAIAFVPWNAYLRYGIRVSFMRTMTA